jgi:osmotically-inducible protein OsmY
MISLSDYLAPCHCEKVMEAARRRLKRSPYPAIRDLSCQFERGTLVLRGCLPSYYQKQLAQVAVIGLEGVVEVVNEAEVSQKQ